MGKAKEAQQVAEDNWRGVAESKGYRCDVCGNLLGYDERDLIGTGLCGSCRNNALKDD